LLHAIHQSLLLADFKENHTLLGFYLNNTYNNKKIPETRKLKSLFMKHILQNGKMRLENKAKTLESEKTRVYYAQKTRLKNAVQEFHPS
jgi:hypothetical protein